MPTPRAILVTGGRAYTDAATVDRVLSGLAPGLLLEGGAEGADRLAREWGHRRGVHVLTCEALWAVYGRSAGPRRNAVLVDVARQLGATMVAFPGGRGTAGCVALARAAGLEVLVVSDAG